MGYRTGQTRILLIQCAWMLRCKGFSLSYIGEYLGVSTATISRWLAPIENRELQRLRATIKHEKIRQTEVLFEVIDEALQAWERSKQPRTRVIRRLGLILRNAAGEPILDPAGDPLRRAGWDEVLIIERDGNPRFLSIVIRALRELRVIWGLNIGPEKSKVEPLVFSTIMTRLKANRSEGESQNHNIRSA